MLEGVAGIIEGMKDKTRVGVCVDTGGYLLFRSW